VNEPTCACGCCAGVTASTPRPLDNRLGLPVIGYRVGVHADFRASLLTALSAADRPALAQLRTRDPRDLTIALLDGFATMCDVLTFYTERLAQESYLRTAVDRLSLQELGRLVAYRLKPGVAAQTYLAFFIQPPPAQPPQTGEAAEAFAPAPYLTSVELPAGMPVRSVPGPGEQPQTFETADVVQASPQWNAWRPRQTRATVLGTGTGVGASAAYFTGTGLQLKIGDMLLFAPQTAPASAFQTRTVTGVEVQPDFGRTYVTWSPAVSTATLPTSPRVHVLRKRLSVFGHNAPLYGLITAATDDQTTDWSSMAVSPVCGAIDLEGTHPEVLVGSWLVLTAPSVSSRSLFQASAVTELSRTDFAISGKVTRVMLNGAFEEYLNFRYNKVREILVYGASEELTLAEEPDPSAVDGGEIVVDAQVSDLPAGRTLLVAGLTGEFESHVEVVTLDSAAIEGSGTRLTLSADLTSPSGLRRETVVVYGNVARATHGETVHQILGSGDASRSYQTFELQHSPLTYVPSDEASGASSSLSVRVNDVEWHEVPTLYPAEPGDRSFVTRDTERGTVIVGFGDGLRAARLPTGQNNVRAIYRKGVGAAGNVATGAISQVMDPPLGLTKVTNPTPATGGADAESPSAAREAIPVAVRTLGRAVSLLDYADYARAFAGIAKAHATVLNLAGGRTIVVTVAAADGTAVPPDACERLTTSLRGHGDPLVSVVVLPHRAPTFRLACKVKRHPDYLADLVLAAVAEEVQSSFGFAVREFVAPVHRSEVVAAIHRVAGVVAVDVDRLYRVAPPSPPEPGWPPFSWLANRLFAAAPRADAAGVALAAELLTVDVDPFDWLVELESSP
jgi:predicted phage baseplate assembly protein